MLIIRLCLFLTADSLPTSRDDYDYSGDYDYKDISSEYLENLGKTIIYEKCTGSAADCDAFSNFFADALNHSEYYYEYYQY